MAWFNVNEKVNSTSNKKCNFGLPNLFGGVQLCTVQVEGAPQRYCQASYKNGNEVSEAAFLTDLALQLHYLEYKKLHETTECSVSEQNKISPYDVEAKTYYTDTFMTIGAQVQVQHP